MGKSRLTYLVTPEAKDYLTRMQILKICIDRKNLSCITSAEIDTRQIMLSGLENRTLFDVMYDMRQLSFTFDFRLNDENQQILVGCFTDAGYLCALFLIRADDQNAVAH